MNNVMPFADQALNGNGKLLLREVRRYGVCLACLMGEKNNCDRTGHLNYRVNEDGQIGQEGVNVVNGIGFEKGRENVNGIVGRGWIVLRVVRK